MHIQSELRPHLRILDLGLLPAEWALDKHVERIHTIPNKLQAEMRFISINHDRSPLTTSNHSYHLNHVPASNYIQD